MFLQTSPVISSSMAGAMEQVLQQPPGSAAGQGEARKGARRDLALPSRTTLCAVGKDAPQTLPVQWEAKLDGCWRVLCGTLISTKTPWEAADGENMDLVC